MTHPLLEPSIVAAVERAASAHGGGAAWTSRGFTDLAARAAHPAGIFLGRPFSVFAKLSSAAAGLDQFRAELAGLNLITGRAGVRTPIPVAAGVVLVPAGCLLLTEALTERAGAQRTRADFLSIGRTLGTLHQVRDARFGLDDAGGFFGPLPVDNRPVDSNRWSAFYAERRLEPMLRLARDSGNLKPGLDNDVARVIARLPDFAGQDPAPSLLHGDAQQNNFLCVAAGPGAGSAVVIDAAPYFGHPEVDLALAGYFSPVPRAVFDGYGEISPIDAGFADRRELWRMFAYLAVIAVAGGDSQWGTRFTARLAAAVHRYR